VPQSAYHVNMGAVNGVFPIDIELSFGIDSCMVPSYS
jgi:hypothetical protein